MTQIADLIRPILESSDFPRVLEEMQALWEEEQRRRQEFYDRITPEDKWEFINGQIVMHSPAKNKHLNAVKHLSGLLDAYVAINELGTITVEKALIPTHRNDYEPDIAYFNQEKAQHFLDDQWKFPAPDLVVEVLSNDSIKRDREHKYHDYAQHGIAEYWIIDPDEQTVEQYVLPGGGREYALKSKKIVGDQLQAHVLPGFVIPVAAIFSEEEKIRVLRELVR